MVHRFFPVLCVYFYLVFQPGVVFAQGPAIVFDPSTDLVIYSEDPDMLWHPASLTKIMTAYVTFEALKSGQLALDSKATYSQLASRQPPSRIGYRVGKQMTIEVALKALIVKSGNDVAVLLAEKVAGTVRAFVKRMNETAKRLGMERTHFINPNGLPDARQVTTARDLGFLSRAIIRDFPDYFYLFSSKSVTVGKRVLNSYNSLLRTFGGADGMKTGFICASGYNIVASATRGGKRLVAVVLGARSTTLRSQRARSLLEYGFQNYYWKSYLFAHDIDTLESDGSVLMGPRNLRNTICSGRKRRKARGKSRKRKPRKKIYRKKSKKKK